MSTPSERPATSPWERLDRPPLRVGALQRALVRPAGPFARLDVLDTVPSTNVELVARAREGGLEDLTVLTTDDQPAGRGRLGRTWTAPARTAVAASVLLRPGTSSSPWNWLPLMGGLAVAEALREVHGVDASVKWPNDVLLAGPSPGKVCGVLSELVTTPEGPAVVMGLGINVLQSRAELPVAEATSLRLAGAAAADRDTVLRSCLRALAARYVNWRGAGGDAAVSGLAAAFRERCSTLGQAVRVELPGGQYVRGLAEGVDDEGRLLVLGPRGVEALAAGDVVHLRPAQGLEQ